MNELGPLIEKLKLSTINGYSDEVFRSVVSDVSNFYIQSLSLENDEVAILLTDSQKSILSFAYPDYLVNAGMIPVTSPDAFAAFIYRKGQGTIENNFTQQKHLHLFEYVKMPGRTPRPVWKMMGTVLKTPEEKIGVIEISRKGTNIMEAGEDFTPENLQFLDRSVEQLTPFIAKVLPKNFRGKLV